MTVQECIDYVSAMKPHDYTNDQMMMWLNQIEGKIQANIHLAEEIVKHESADDVLLLGFPFEDVYYSYLIAMIDYANGEYDNYEATATAANRNLTDYEKWYLGARDKADAEARKEATNYGD